MILLLILIPLILNQMTGVAQYHFHDDWCEEVSKISVSMWYPNNKCIDEGMQIYSKYYWDGSNIHAVVTCGTSSCQDSKCTDLTYVKDQCYQPGKYMFTYGALNRTAYPDLYFEYTYAGEGCNVNNLAYVYLHPAKCKHAFGSKYSYYQCDPVTLELKQVFFNNSKCEFDPIHYQAVSDSCNSVGGWPTSSRLSCKELV